MITIPDRQVRRNIIDSCSGHVYIPVLNSFTEHRMNLIQQWSNVRRSNQLNFPVFEGGTSILTVCTIDTNMLLVEYSGSGQTFFRYAPAIYNVVNCAWFLLPAAVALRVRRISLICCTYPARARGGLHPLDPEQRTASSSSTHGVINSIIYQNRARLPVPHCSAICLGGNYNYDNYLHSLRPGAAGCWQEHGCCFAAGTLYLLLYVWWLCRSLGVDNGVDKHNIWLGLVFNMFVSIDG